MSQTIKLLSWNVNGIRAQEKKGFIDWLKNCDADVIGLQETKAHLDQLNENLINVPGFQSFWVSGERKGYSGVAVYSRLQPIRAMTEFPTSHLNSEGRTIGLEFENFYFFNLYCPNGGQGMHRVQYKLEYYQDFYHYISALDKPVIFCGDLNTAHQEIDLARPNENRKTSGFMDIEREWLNFLTSQGYIDTFRLFHPETKDKYTWWDMQTRARDRNVGWRIDYFFASPNLKNNLIDASIEDQVMGSDHCPVSLTIKI